MIFIAYISDGVLVRELVCMFCLDNMVAVSSVSAEQAVHIFVY